MRDLISDYRKLRALQPQQVAAWVHEEFPTGVRGRWCLALLDNALTDHFPGNNESAEDFRSRLDLAAALLPLAEAARNMPEIFMPEWYMKFARQAVEKDLRDVPDSMTPDAAARRALGFFRLTREQAIRAAADERAEHIRVLTTTAPGADFSIPETADGKRLITIIALLRDVAWFADKVTDSELASYLQAWLGVREQLGLGEEVTRLNREWTLARMHATEYGRS